MNINDLLEQKRELVKAMEEIRNRVYSQQDGEWRGDDTKKFDDLSTQDDAKTAEIQRLAKLDAARGSLEPEDESAERRSEPTQPTRNAVARDVAGKRNPDVEARGLQAWMLGGTDQRTAAHAEIAQRAGLSLDQKSITLRLAPVAPRSLRAEDMRAWEQRYLGVDVISPDTGSHYTTQVNVLKPLEEAMLAFGGVYSVATVDRTDNGGDLPYPLSNDTSNEGYLIGESVQDTTEAEPTLDQLVLQSFTYSSGKIKLSLEYVQDNAINAVGRIGGMLGERLARIRNRHFTVGDGSSKPNGIVTAATASGVTAASATTFSYDNFVDLEHSVDPAYRNGARFMFADASLKVIKKIKVPQYSGDTAGVPLWKAGMTSGDPDTINGYQYVINQHMAAPTAGNKAVIFGALNKYQVREVRDITLVRLDELFAEYRQVAFVAWARFDGDLLDAGTHPVKYMVMA